MDNEKKIVILSNHSNYLDCLILYYLFQCGFVASDFLNTINIGKILVNKLNLLVFKREVKAGGNVERIKEYFKFQLVI